MIFGLVTFTKVKSTPTILHIEECYPLSYDTVDNAPEVGKLEGDTWMWGANQLVLWVFYNDKIIWQYFVLYVTTLET